jgi:hypothetical protein
MMLLFGESPLFRDRQNILVGENWLKRGMNAPPSSLLLLDSISSLLTRKSSWANKSSPVKKPLILLLAMPL